MAKQTFPCMRHPQLMSNQQKQQSKTNQQKSIMQSQKTIIPLRKPQLMRFPTLTKM